MTLEQPLARASRKRNYLDYGHEQFRGSVRNNAVAQHRWLRLLLLRLLRLLLLLQLLLLLLLLLLTRRHR
jgi:hypothetical protein